MAIDQNGRFPLQCGFAAVTAEGDDRSGSPPPDHPQRRLQGKVGQWADLRNENARQEVGRRDKHDGRDDAGGLTNHRAAEGEAKDEKRVDGSAGRRSCGYAKRGRREVDSRMGEMKTIDAPTQAKSARSRHRGLDVADSKHPM